MVSTESKTILITGAPGVGKTTLIRRLVVELGERRCAGFYTEEIRKDGVRKGFELISLDGRKAMLAHVDSNSPYRVGRYGVDVVRFDLFLEPFDFAHTNAEVVIVDEIGKMEIFSQKFNLLLEAAFSSNQQLVATISAGGPRAIQRFKKREDVVLFEVTRLNRDRLVKKIAALAAHR